jgi:hypothetical protein
MADSEPDHAVLYGVQLLGQALVAHLARSPRLRANIAASSEAVDELSRVEHLAVGATWVLHLLRQRSGELMVIHAEAGKGLRVAYENIANCFHLFTLLQGAIHRVMPGAKTPDARVLAAAVSDDETEVRDSAWWHYGQAHAKRADIAATVFGELGPESIAQVHGKQVLLLWNPVLQSRSWDSGFFRPILHAALPAVKLLGELTVEETSEWWAALELPHPLPQSVPKPWWKVW